MADQPDQRLVQELRRLRTQRGVDVKDVVLAHATRFPGADARGLSQFLHANGRQVDGRTVWAVFEMLEEARQRLGIAVPQTDPAPAAAPREPVGATGPREPTRAAGPRAPSRAGAAREPARAAAGPRKEPRLEEPPGAEEPDLDRARFPRAVDFSHMPEESVHSSHLDPGWQLRWAGAGPGLLHAVVLNDSRYPESPGDGILLAVTEGTTCTTKEPGSFVAVFAAAPCDPAAVVHAHGRVFHDVELLVVEPQPGAVLLRWRRPEAVDDVVVLRSEPDRPLPAGVQPAYRIPVSRDELLDEDVQPGRRYEYRVLVCVRDGDDSYYSRGLGKVVEVPAPLHRDVALTAEFAWRHGEPGARVQWRTPPAQTTRLFLVPEPPPQLLLGSVHPLEQLLAQLGETEVVQPRDTADGTTRIEWLPFPAAEPGPAAPNARTLLALTVSGPSAAVAGRQVVRWVAGAPLDPTVHERLDWQLLRFGWPEGADFVQVCVVEPGAPASAGQTFLWDDELFHQHGGVVFDPPLPPQGADLLVRGGTQQGPRRTYGPHVRTSYAGREVVRYDLVPGRSRFKPAERLLQLTVEKPLRTFRFVLVGHPDRLPLSPRDEGCRVLASPTLQAGTLHPGKPQVVADVVLPRELTHLKAFAYGANGDLVVVDPLPRVSPVVVEGLPVRLEPQVRCPRCLSVSGLQTQFFRCQGSCPPVPDEHQQRALGLAAPPVERRVTDVPARVTRGARPGDPPVVETRARVVCRHCNEETGQRICPVCHWDLPPQWEDADVLAVQLVGARGTGKTSYLMVLLAHLRTTLADALHCNVHPVNAQAERLDREVDEFLRSGLLPASTVSVRSNAALLEPAIFDLGHHPSGQRRALLLFDSAGDDMERAPDVARYGLALSRSDLVIMLVDVLQLDPVRTWLQGSVVLPPKAGNPDRVLANVAAEVRNRRSQAGGPPPSLAVVLSKFDGVQSVVQLPDNPLHGLLNPGHRAFQDPYHAGTRAYLEADAVRLEAELRSLLQHLRATATLRAVDGTFPRSRFSALSALGHSPENPHQTGPFGWAAYRAGEPLRWLFARRGWLPAHP